MRHAPTTERPLWWHEDARPCVPGWWRTDLVRALCWLTVLGLWLVWWLG